MKVGIFDSGIGGLNVLNELLKEYPSNQYYYYGDTKNIPYGDKDKKTLLSLSKKIIAFFEAKKVDLIIIACGTISSNCYHDLKKVTTIPIYDIITPTIEYLKEKSDLKKGVLATKRTISSHVFQNNLENILAIAAQELVLMIEENKIDIKVIKNYMQEFQDRDILVLGCTHYPLLMKEFKKFLKKEVEIVDMGKCLTRKIKLPNTGKSEIKLYFTKIDKTLIKNISRILNCKYEINLIEN